jgi:2-dehydro-3-deoxyphosphogluconate aldolase/(4S)-4-hydroxy-2-oxoglutarate aldolase
VSVLDISPVIPVVIIEEVATAVPMAAALMAGGIGVIEVTLRSPAALDAIRAICAEVGGMVVGAGTVNTPQQVRQAIDAGSSFLVSPGATDPLLDALQDAGRPFLCGTATPSEMLRLLGREVFEAKLFPAVAVGGLTLLRAVHSPIPQLRFCPTGGITRASAPEFLALPNVGCVGGTWLTPADAVAQKDWTRITALAAEAVALR